MGHRASSHAAGAAAGDLVLRELTAQADEVAFGFAQGEVHAPILWTDRYKSPYTGRMASDRIPHAFPDVRHRRGGAPASQAAARRRLPASSGDFGFDEGTAGHITARDPELSDHFWVNPLGMSFRQIRVKDLMLVNHEGEVVEGTWPLNLAAFVIHSQIHAARPDVVSAAHSHSVHGKAWSSAPAAARPADPGCLCVLRATTWSSTTTPAPCSTSRRGSGSRTPWAVRRPRSWPTTACSPSGTAWTRRRGGSSPWSARCQAQLLAEAAGTPVPIGREVAEKTARQTGGHRVGWVQFQPLYDVVVAEEPDLLEE